MENKKSNTQDRELRITRVLDAPVELVWEVFVQPEHIANWWGPNGFTNTIDKMDVRPGGEWNFVMHGPDGTDFDNRYIYQEIVPLKKIMYKHVSYPPMLVTIEMERQGEQTLLSWRGVFESKEQLAELVRVYKADAGLVQNVEKLNIYVRNLLKTKNPAL